MARARRTTGRRMAPAQLPPAILREPSGNPWHAEHAELVLRVVVGFDSGNEVSYQLEMHHHQLRVLL